VFSAIDLKSGYWQIPMDKASKHLTAFATPDGATYQYRVMPFGLKNAPATFQKLMTRVLEGHLGKFAHVYLDDIIIFSRDHREHLVHLRLILERLQEYGLRCATEKCRFGVTELPYLGHIVGGNHNRPQPKHLEQIRSAPTPTTRKQLQSFLGLANWVRDYVPRFAELAAPITDLLNKKGRYRWTEEAQQAFEALKEAMSRPLHLHRPDPRKRFFLQTDASGVGIAAVLYQEEEDRRLVISHASAKLNQTQQKDHINEQECLAIVWAVRRYRAYLEDQEFTLRTDNKALLWLNTAKNSNAKLTRWALLLQEFKFQVEHCPGKSNQLPDLLSRDPTGPELTEEAESVDRMFFPWTETTEAANDTTTTTLAVAEVVTLADEIKLAQQQDPEFPGIVLALLKPDPKNPVTPLSRATMRSGTDISGYGQNHHYSGCHQQHGHGYCMSSTTLQTLAILVAKRQSEPSARSTRGLPSPRTSTNISEPASSAPRPSEAPSRHAHHDEPTFQKGRGRPSPSIIWDPTRGHQLGTGSCSW
jgi:hypothetical protein